MSKPLFIEINSESETYLVNVNYIVSINPAQGGYVAHFNNEKPVFITDEEAKHLVAVLAEYQFS